MIDKLRINEFDDFIEQFARESDRAAVILGAAKLDQQLYFLLLGHLLPASSKTDELLEGDHPLSEFSARIKLCYRLGLIDQDFAKALDYVRKIRNNFAHRLDAHLDQSPQREWMKLVVQIVNSSELCDDVRLTYFSDADIREFYVSIAVLAVRLETLILSVKQITDKDAAAIAPSKYLTTKG